MKQEFEMIQQEMDDIIAINKNNPPVMNFGGTWSGLDLQDRINSYWECLGDKYGFNKYTVEPSAKGNLFFLATPKSKVIPKTQTEIEVDKYLGDALGYLSLSVQKAIGKIVEQFEKCDYQTEDALHSLKDNIAFIALKQLSN